MIQAITHALPSPQSQCWDRVPNILTIARETGGFEAVMDARSPKTVPAPALFHEAKLAAWGLKVEIRASFRG